MYWRLLLSIPLAAATLAAQCRVPVWADEFEGTAIDRSKWSFQTGAGGWGNQELENYTDREANATVRDGRLVITARREELGGAHYTSARLRTIQHGDWRYGRFEARMKLPVAQGMWPAFWMMPTDSIYGGWPRSGEMDIMELIGKFPARVYGTLHTVDNTGKHVSFGALFDLFGATFDADLHVFALEWEPDEIRIYVDDQLYSTQKKPLGGGATWPFDQRFHILLNLAVGGSWPGAPDATTPFPQTLEVDWVRVSQRPEDIQIEGPPLVEPWASTVVYRIPAIPDATYSWTLPDGAWTDGATDSNEIAVNWGDASGAVTLHLTTACGEADLSLPVTVSPNLWLNPAFDDGLRFWSTRAATSGQATFSVEAEGPDGFAQSASIQVARQGVNYWDVQLTRPQVPLTAKQNYRLTFWGRSDDARPISVAFIDAGDYTSYAQRGFDLTPEWQPFTWEFSAPRTAAAQMNLDLARSPGLYRFTGFRFERIP